MLLHRFRRWDLRDSIWFTAANDNAMRKIVQRKAPPPATPWPADMHPVLGRIYRARQVRAPEELDQAQASLDEAIVFVKELEEAALEFGFKGSCYWTMRCFEQTRLWNLMWEDGKMLKAFSE